jgi:hypothetical protein
MSKKATELFDVGKLSEASLKKYQVKHAKLRTISKSMQLKPNLDKKQKTTLITS